MALAFFFALLAQRVAFVGDELDAETLERMREREVFLQEQMTLQWQHVENLGQSWIGIRALSSVLPYWKVCSLLERMREVFLRKRMEKLPLPLPQLEESNLKKSRVDIQALLFSVLPYWKVCSVLCILFLFLWFMWKIYKKFQRTEDISDEESSISKQEQQEKAEEEGSNLLRADVLWPDQIHRDNCEQILLLFGRLINLCQYLVSDTFFPVPERPIGVGSAYEGWCPPENEPIFCLLVPLSAPRGHVFHLDLGAAGELPARNSRIRVDLECTCGREQEMGMRCFLHTSEEELGNQRPSLLRDFCKDAYLDVEKTARWFQVLITNAWKYMPEAETCSMNVAFSRRSCRIHLTDIHKTAFVVEIVFGVQQENTDIFLSSQETEAAFTPSTTWPQSCAVAEAKFFQHIATHDQGNTFNLRYVQVGAHILAGQTFSPYQLRTVLMHLLTAIPLESWHGSYFLQRMDDILRYLRCCVEEKRLNHFLIGNEDVPAEIILPQEFRASQPLNLLQHLVQDPDSYEQALQELEELQDRLTGLLIYWK
ncbi:inositol 1,4,5-trisphosphate receptor-interacting protein-like 1 [Coturnix japonica]|uniref:Inositol 1,4,5-trisphosphate receptor-interacting protein-like 1 n=1 Tax=Coturnix japonica TaxID=93934 RepID=A0A8C2TPN5_COTJA|nr:inositol 1,4,5-trisphosphate receptor-interacting protein-like 1 [Coturnix japonica]